jgi:hypothetical protein
MGENAQDGHGAKRISHASGNREKESRRKGKTKREVAEKKHEKTHLPLHEQIKRQLSKTVKAEPTKKQGEEKPAELLRAISDAAGEHSVMFDKPAKEIALARETGIESAKDHIKTVIPLRPEPKRPVGPLSSISGFEKTMMNRIEIERSGEQVELRISGTFGLEKKIKLKSGELSGFLQSLLPAKINSMMLGEELAIVGMSTADLSDLFKTDIIVEPKGELEVAEEEAGGGILIRIRMAGSRDSLFSQPVQGKPNDILRTGPEKEKNRDGDWLREQIRAQSKEIAELAKEMGDRVASDLTKPQDDIGNSTRKNVVQIEQQAEVKVETRSPTVVAPEKTPPKAEEAKAGDERDPEAEELFNAYREEAGAYVEQLGKVPELKESPANVDLIGELQRSANDLKTMSTAMGFANISRLSKSLENLFASYKKRGAVDAGGYEILEEAVAKVQSLYANLENSEQEDVNKVVEKVEAATS